MPKSQQQQILPFGRTKGAAAAPKAKRAPKPKKPRRAPASAVARPNKTSLVASLLVPLYPDMVESARARQATFGLRVVVQRHASLDDFAAAAAAVAAAGNKAVFPPDYGAYMPTRLTCPLCGAMIQWNPSQNNNLVRNTKSAMERHVTKHARAAACASAAQIAADGVPPITREIHRHVGTTDGTQAETDCFRVVYQIGDGTPEYEIGRAHV